MMTTKEYLMKTIHQIFTSILITSSIFLSGCGGGSAESSDSNTNQNIANSAPVAEAGNNQNVEMGSQVNLNGSASTDADGDDLTYLWQFTAQPDGSKATLSSNTVQQPVFTTDLAGTYTVSLVA
ncbi:MAG: hypothetical protein ACI9YH_004334, partial [Colwellia sp.]